MRAGGTCQHLAVNYYRCMITKQLGLMVLNMYLIILSYPCQAEPEKLLTAGGIDDKWTNRPFLEIEAAAKAGNVNA